MGEVKVLSYKYLYGGIDTGQKSNDYSGSLSLNPERHNALDDEFKYRFILRKCGDEFKVVAQCYVGNVSFDNVDSDKIKELEFEGSDDGVNQAREWVQGAYDTLIERRGE